MKGVEDSPRKGGLARARARARARDVIELPAPYSLIRSDDMKRWDREIGQTTMIDESTAENAIVKDMAFTNALVLKMSQLAKQVQVVCRVYHVSERDFEYIKCF